MYINLKKAFLIPLIMLFLGLEAKAVDHKETKITITELALDTSAVEPGKWKVKLAAVGLALSLGPFGVHRIYLGTSTFVPIAYTITLGGGLGILPVLDIITILLTRDLDKLTNHRGMFLFLPDE